MVEECLCCTIISHQVFTASDRPQWFWAWWADSSVESLQSRRARRMSTNKHAAHASSNEGAQMKKVQTGSASQSWMTRRSRCLGGGCLSGKVQNVCLSEEGGFISPPLPAAHLGRERSIWDGPGRTSAMATPVGRRGRPGRALSVFVD